MKVIKYVFLLLILATVAVAVFIATQEGKYDIKREKVINVPASTLYTYINDYRNWEHVGILTHNDSTAAFTYTDTTSGPGAAMFWRSPDVDGKISTLKTIVNDSILQRAIIDGQSSDIAWGFRDSGNGTRVGVRIKGELSFRDKAYAVFQGNVKDELEQKMDKGLENLNSFLVNELGKYNVSVQGLVTKTATYYVGFPVTGKIEEIGRKSADIYPRLNAFIKENKIVVAGAPFLLYKTFEEAKGISSYVVCMPIRDEMYTMPGSDITGGKIERFTALKATLKGDYSHLKKAWDAARREVSAKGHPENTTGQYLEVYTLGLPKVKRPSQWVTDIYIPIGTPTIAEPVQEVALPPVTGSQNAAPARTVSPSRAHAPAQAGSTTTQPQDKPGRPKPKTTTITRPTTLGIPERNP